MAKRVSLFISLFLICTSVLGQSFTVGKGSFLLNGEPFVIKAAELHYPRIPRPYWEHRIKMCKALGMNTICLYVFWNFHEEEEGIFDFGGQADLAEFCRLCQENGMYVILRPGPYVCAEWEMGGLPWWLLKNEHIRLREDDTAFLNYVDRFEHEVALQVGDMTIDKGGPIIMIQVENEYGSYGTNKKYVAEIRDIIRRHFGEKVTLFQCDWSSNFTENALDDLLWTINFGTGADINQQFELLKQLRPESPLMCSEYWSGWFDKWGANHETRPADAMIAGIEEMLKKNISFSLYMTHGGTNWGHWAGANSPGFAPDVTSYDYDAPITESGQITPKYTMLRDLMAKYSLNQLPLVPATVEPIEIESFYFSEAAPLFENLPTPVVDCNPRPMEFYNQGFGSILYRTILPEIDTCSKLSVDKVCDYAQIFIDDNFIGSLDRRNGDTELLLPPVCEGAKLDILVEAMGRINFGRAINDHKGITNKVMITAGGDESTKIYELNQWEVFNLHDKPDFYSSMNFKKIKSVNDNCTQRIPGCYRAKFYVEKPGDTFLNFETWGKGLVYVNGYPLGRFWEIGPQQTLYMPGCWLKEGENEILVFDITGPAEAKTEGLKEPIIDKLKMSKDRNNKEFSTIDKKLVHSGCFKAEKEWQKVTFNNPVQGRYVSIEAVNSHNNSSRATISEIRLIDKNGKRIPEEQWSVVCVSSEDIDSGNHTAEKAFDLQETTCWMSNPAKKFPHNIVIDLGSSISVSGLEYLSSVDSNVTDFIKQYKIYIFD